MPALELSGRHQKAVLWAANGYDDYGQPEVDAAIEITVRWETGLREAIGPQGGPIAFDGLAVVDREIAVGSIMWLGALAALPSPATDLKQVVDYTETPDIKARAIRRTVKLAKYSDTLPDLA